jgi:Flp pilus assembly protein TadG
MTIRWFRRGQSLVEFALTIGLVMVLVVATAQLAIYLNYRNSLSLACKEGAFEAGLAGHTLADGKRTATDLWQKLEPSNPPLRIGASQSSLMRLSLESSAPTIVPVPIPPFTKIPITASCAHTIERFQPGSSP